MDKEELKTKIDLNNIEERIFMNMDIEYKQDYIIDNEGNAIIPIPPLIFKLIEEIKALKIRIEIVEKR